MAAETTKSKEPGEGGFVQKLLDGIEKVGNKVPHPVIMFLYLIAIIAVLSQILYMFRVSVTEEIAIPVPIEILRDVRDALGGSIVAYDVYTGQPAYIPEFIIEEQTIPIQSLLTVPGLRFVFSSFVANFAGFGVVAVTLVAMAGVGVAEQAGMMAALIRKLVKVAPRNLIAFILILVGVLSSVASDAGYLILIPLAATAFLTLGRHPLAGMAAAFAGVSAIFAVNVLITPIDSMITEITNEAIGLAGGAPITVTANYFFSVASTLILTVVAVIVTERIIEPRLGKYEGEGLIGDEELDPEAAKAEARGLQYALYGFLIVFGVVLLLSLPPGAPLRHPVTGNLIGTTPFMDSLIFIISLIFLISGIGYGLGAKTIKSSNDVISAVTKTFAGLSGLIFMLLMISQFIAFFNYTNLPRVIAVVLANALEQANIGALPLLVGMILVIILLNFIIPGVVPKWAIFAPIFIPLFIRLEVAPQTVLAAYRIGDSPTNVLTPLMVYLPFIVTVAQKYQKDAGLGTVIALMIPYTLVIAIVWILLFVVWFLLGIPLGPGYPVNV
ncbi:AbgT family transporter [Candidatus Chloroploca asiatica]|uniref:p-aminobenzoyl-glutamate transporter n=1 Tax=Candidatus Chloroploca asiatica TaxID=1506545 RepID=A0A2H3KXE3_9CHLR|nr:AbgT family transporter [Candidatus Chloroploca asiatica]PDV98658.1 p-aminobenzoyl-glutamate transporter [Candidatus Chloroploca asiatica]